MLTMPKRVQKPIFKKPEGKVAATLSLDDKIKAFFEDEEVKNIGDDTDSIATLPWGQYFNGGDMSALWSRLQGKMQAADPDTKKNWGSLGALPMREGKQAKKRTVLWLALKYPRDWASRSTSYMQRLLRTETTAAKEIPKTKGELIQIHGVDETEELIRKGFFQEVQIKGVQHYVKISFERENRMEKQHEESMSLSKSIASEEIHELESAFEQYKLGLDLGWTSSGGWSGTSNKSLGHGGSQGALPAEAGDSKARPLSMNETLWLFLEQDKKISLRLFLFGLHKRFTSEWPLLSYEFPLEGAFVFLTLFVFSVSLDSSPNSWPPKEARREGTRQCRQQSDHN